jgi:hypothetical protein
MGETQSATLVRYDDFAFENVDRILRGEKSADLPVQAHEVRARRQFKAAKGLGLTVPDKLLARADEAIE